MNSFYTQQELQNLGFNKVGKNVLISRKASFYDADNIRIGDNVRIDDFCILSGKITIGNYVHISAYAALYGKNGIILGNYTNVGVRSTIFSAIDTLDGNYLAGSMAPEHTRNVVGGAVEMKDFSAITSHCFVFPNITIGEGCVVGAMSLVNKDLEAWGIYAGIPARRIKEREKGLLKFI
jgi:galactoside O-acetyltransferase